MLMNKSPLISIITPVYNVERYLRQCIESIINQTFQDWELLLIDDGATDDSGIICDEYAARDERIRVLHKENTGQADSRNIALLQARADLIGFVDSDDWIEPDMYELLYQTLTVSRSDIAVCGYYLDYRDKAEVSCNEGDIVMYGKEEALALILEDQTIKSYLWDKLFRKEAITCSMPKFFYYEDYATLFKWFADVDKVAFCRKPKYHYRQRRGSTDHDQDPRKKFHFFLAEQERYNYLMQNQLLQEKEKEFQFKVVRVGLQEAKNIARYTKDSHEALRYLKQIREILWGYLPGAHGVLGLRKRLRLWKLMYAPFWFYCSMRLSGLFIIEKRNRRKRLYE